MSCAKSSDGATTTMAYDSWGRMTSKTQGAYSATYAYRYGERLRSVTSNFVGEADVTYQYNGVGRRITRTTGGSTTKYAWDVRWNLLCEDDASNNLQRTMTIANPGARVSSVLAAISGSNPSSGTPRYYVRDHLGSTRGAFDASKTAQGRYEYNPYGDLYTGTGESLSTLAAAFTGKPYDAATGMYYFPYRDYSPTAARWTTRDPLGMVDGPNIYLYVMANPVSGTDALGAARDSVSASFWRNPKFVLEVLDAAGAFLEREVLWRWRVKAISIIPGVQKAYYEALTQYTRAQQALGKEMDKIYPNLRRVRQLQDKVEVRFKVMENLIDDISDWRKVVHILEELLIHNNQ